MARLIVLALAVLALAAVVAGVAQSGPPPEHPHMLVLGLELDENENPVSYRKCVDLAANQALTLNAHHQSVHTGTAGLALFLQAGHAVVPGAPLTPWANCEQLIGHFFP